MRTLAITAAIVVISAAVALGAASQTELNRLAIVGLDDDVAEMESKVHYLNGRLTTVSGNVEQVAGDVEEIAALVASITPPSSASIVVAPGEINSGSTHRFCFGESVALRIVDVPGHYYQVDRGLAGSSTTFTGKIAAWGGVYIDLGNPADPDPADNGDVVHGGASYHVAPTEPADATERLWFARRLERATTVSWHECG